MSAAAKFARIAWGLLAYNLVVIAWGAYVRASGSGAGCGSHWPLCNGEIVPRAAATKTLVEYSHRLSSGLVLILAIAMAVTAFRVFPRGAAPRRGSVWVLALTVGEALIGAGLVLFELVAHDASMKRALSMGLHLVNTFFLLAALTLTARSATVLEHDAAAPRRAATLPPLHRWLFVACGIGLLLAGTTGGIAALGDTLFPAANLADGLAQDLSASAHFLLRLRVLHPVVAVTAGLSCAALATFARATLADRKVARWSRAVSLLVVVQLAVGLANVALLAPIALQLVHLLVADLFWIAFVMLWASAAGAAEQRSAISDQRSAHAG